MKFTEIAKMSDAEARAYFEGIRWKDGVKCAHCGHDSCCKLNGTAHREGVYKCRNRECRKQFTVTTGTIFHSSHLSLKQWMLGFHMMASSKKGVSALQLQRMLDIGSYKCAWHLAHRIRHVMAAGSFEGMLVGPVEVDETYVGGKVDGKGRGFRDNKTPVVSLVERNGGRKRSVVMGRVTGQNIKAAVLANVAAGDKVHTDEHRAYVGLDKLGFDHESVNHKKEQYTKRGKDGGKVTTNTVESSFALLKRGIVGAFHHVSKKHLHRYCAEFDFRWNHRAVKDGERFESALSRTQGKRLQYKEPICA